MNQVSFWTGRPTFGLFDWAQIRGHSLKISLKYPYMVKIFRTLLTFFTSRIDPIYPMQIRDKSITNSIDVDIFENNNIPCKYIYSFKQSYGSHSRIHTTHS